jgi:site-specific DNA-methyltransferase (adenine-specific)
MADPYYNKNDFSLYLGDYNYIVPYLNEEIDLVFADPPYFLSNNGLTIQSGKLVSVNKGDWDKLDNNTLIEFNHRWLKNVRDKMNKNATIWISGTMHNIYSIYQVLIDLGFKILNTIIWEKTNPPPNYSCRTFTHSNELIIWARKTEQNAHYYNYELMKFLNGGKQMKDVWKLPALLIWEKQFGKHPTQKPLSILCRIIDASSKPGMLVLDPFAGSSTTGIAANLFERRFIGIDKEVDYLELSVKRKEALESQSKMDIISKINGLEDFFKFDL